MRINNTEIEPGTHKKIKLRVGYLPSGTEINIYAHVFRGLEEGPNVLILAGVHGDEINGVETIRRLIENAYFEKIAKGSVVVVPLLNVFGFINFSRDVPDGKDVNRSFPGNNRGSLAARVARKLTKSILPYIDFGIDLHTGGDARYNYPQVRITKKDPASVELATIFNAPFTIEKPRIMKSLRKVAADMGIPILVFEGGESKRLDGFSIDIATRGIHNVLSHYGMIEESGKEPQLIETVSIVKTAWVRASEAGLFIWSKSSGVFVQKGEELGVIKDVQGNRSVMVRARMEGYIIGHNNAPVVNSGDALFYIGILE
jgi:predicted deacylase